MNSVKLLATLGLTVGLLFAGDTHAQKTADITVDEMTNAVIDVVMDAKESGAELDEFGPKLDKLMSNYADFNWIARNIMGSFREQATDAQVAEFGATFRHVMINTYAKSFLAYNGQTVTTLPVESKYAGKRKVPVRQTVDELAGGLNVVYTMGQKRDGHWVMLNLRVNGVNLGQTYQQQFRRMMAEYDSIDEVIAQWGK